MKGPIEGRLEASLKYDAINGDAQERAVVGRQIREAIAELRRLRTDRGSLATMTEVAEAAQAIESQAVFLRRRDDDGDTYPGYWIEEDNWEVFCEVLKTLEEPKP